MESGNGSTLASSRGRPCHTFRSPLFRYVAAATLVRTADGGAAVALILLTISMHGRVANATSTGALLAALLTAPQVLAPVVGGRLDRARDARVALAAGFVTFGVALLAAAVLITHGGVVAAGALVCIAGLCAPLLTGGLSSRLGLMVAADPVAQRRADGWDALTYGLAGTLGPAGVAGLVAAGGPLLAVSGLAALAALAGGVALTLPPAPGRAADRCGIGDAARIIARTGPLRRVLVVTVLTALGAGGIMVMAVVLGGALSGSTVGGAVLGAAYGLGGLTGSVVVTAFPMRGEAERMTIRFVLLAGSVIVLCAMASAYAVALILFVLAGACGSLLFTATLAVRSEHSPVEARSLVFVTLAGLKMAGASAGTALAGSLAEYGPRVLLVAAGCLTLAAAGIGLLDRKLTSKTTRARGR